MIVVEVEHILPAPGREAAEPAGVAVALQNGLAQVLPPGPWRIGKACRSVGRGHERQENHDPAPVYWNVIFAAVPVFDGPAPALVCDANVANRLAVRKAPPASRDTRP